MLTLYRRHLSTCGHAKKDGKDATPRGTKSDEKDKCKCPIWVQGTWAGKPMRKSLDVTVWGRAERLLKEIETGASDIGFADAKEAFIADLKARNVSNASVRKFELLLDKLPARSVARITVPDLHDFRNSWTWGPLTSAKYLERLRSFFKFCVQNGWRADNPALLIKNPKVPPTQVKPFEPEEVTKIIAEAEKKPRHLAMVLLLRHSALRIADAVCLKRNRIKEGKLFLYTAKTGQPVWLPLPEPVTEALQKCPNGSRDFFFWTGVGKKQTAVNNWRDDLKRLFERAGVPTGHPHRFRHTLAASLLEQGVPISEVAMILGNSAKIVEKHYAGWNLARQKKLEQLVQTTWEKKPKLVRVK